MFSYIKKLTSGFFQAENDVSEDELEDEEKIISKLVIKEEQNEPPETSPLPDDKPLGQSKPIEFDVELFKFIHKTGTITEINRDYGIIDNVIYFEPDQVSLAFIPKVNDVVSYTAYRAKENETERVYKILGLKDSSWDCEEKKEKEEVEIVKEEEVAAITREINGRVIKRKGRQFFIEPANIWCNLDQIEASYVPVEGDWVALEAKVKVDESIVDLVGDILEVKSLKPLLMKTGIGRITLWSDVKREGVIENLIYFSQIICEEGYIPNFGDEVFYDAIESDQDSYKWRALSIFPEKIAKNIPVRDEKLAYYDKNGISILPAVCSVEVELHQTKKVTVEIKNNGNTEHLLVRSRFKCSKEKSQLYLKSHRYNESALIKPKEVIQYVFECRGKFLGFSRETFVFHFKNFTIAKNFEINVGGNKEMNELLYCKVDTVFKRTRYESQLKKNITAETVLYGSKTWKPLRFKMGERRGVYKVPESLWTALGGDSECPKSKQETLDALVQYAPYLKEDLHISHYSDRFHILLYLEEIELKRTFRNYDMHGVFLLKNDEHLVLEVPGLVEQRPSLIVGDKVILSQPWSEANNVQQVGYIQEIRQKDIFIRFHQSFHDSYDESECDVIFEPSTGNFSKCHDAVNRSLRVLGAKWLFPSSVDEKPLQVDVEVAEESDTTTSEPSEESQEKLVKSESVRTKKKLTWCNTSLNERQKLAVVSILKGQGRPLPYIVFGPPGTGKTITLVEVVLQIIRLIPESRVLVTTPSNSSADLICERLIDFGKFRPGQLVRLMAINKALNGNIPLKLVPYCAVVDINTDNENSSVYTNQNGMKLSSMSMLVGRQRVTVGTCICTGSLHYMGFSSGHFTHILVDEAGQATEPDVLVSASFQNPRNGQVVLIGDPRQLGPVCISSLAKRFGLGASLLQRFISIFPYTRDFDGFPETSGYDPRFITKLNVNYRSVPEILSLPSQLFYNGELKPTISQTKGPEADVISKFNQLIDIGEKVSAIFFHGVIGQNYQESDSPSWYNPHEIWLAVTYIKTFYEIGLTSDDVGIVTPYIKQVQKLRELLAELNLSVPKIGTVEDFQGQERQAMILSTVRSSWNYLSTDIKHSLGFVASPRRLNVALTRARALLIILGNPLLLSTDPYWKNVVDYCVKNKSYTGCNIDNLSEELPEE